MLAGSSCGVNMTVKWDGAPAIICGVNPENGKFFVGTKSVFNKTPKINYSTSDIRKNHDGEVAKKLQVCLANLSRLNIKGILQGDLLFTDDLKLINIDGEKMISFTPKYFSAFFPTMLSLFLIKDFLLLFILGELIFLILNLFSFSLFSLIKNRSPSPDIYKILLSI